MSNIEKALNKYKKALNKPERTETVQFVEHSNSNVKRIPSQDMNELESGPFIQNQLVMRGTNKTNFFISLFGTNKSEGCEVITGAIDKNQNTVCQTVLKVPDKENNSESLLDRHSHDGSRFETILQNLVMLGKCSEGLVKKDKVFQLIMNLLNDMVNGESALLVIDDTQNILLPLMEQTKILSRMEAEKGKLLQIIILWQKKRIQSLHSLQLKQTYQRISVRQKSDKLIVDEIRKNIENRLKIDGSKEGISFSTEALTFIRNNSLGISCMADLMFENGHLSLHNKKATEIKEEIIGRTVECLRFPKEQIDKNEENLISKIEHGVTIGGLHKRADKYEGDKEDLLQRKEEVGICLDNSRTGKKNKDLKKVYLICFDILAIILVVGVVVNLLNRKQDAKEDLNPLYTSTVPLHAENSDMTIQDISKTTRDVLDSEIKLINHQQGPVNTFNNAVKYHNHNYHAATSILDMEGLDTQSGKPPLIIHWKPWVNKLDSEGYVMVPGTEEEVLLKEGKQKLIYGKHENVSALYEDTNYTDYENIPINISSDSRVLTIKMAKLYGIQVLKDYSIEKKQLAQKDLSTAKEKMSIIYKTLLAYSPISGNEELVEVVKSAQSSWYQMEKMLSIPPSTTGFLDVLDISDRLLADNEMMTSYVDSFLPVHISEIINVSGRLRMYAQKLARDYLAVSMGVDKEYRVDLMLDSAIEFESAMFMMEDVTRKTAKIKGLIKSITMMEWRKVYETVTECIESDSIEFNVSMMMKFCDTLLDKTNRLTKLYLEVVKT